MNGEDQPQQSRRNPTPGQSLREYGRGVAGGLLFSLPLLYTEEVWQFGATLSPNRMLAALFFTFLLLLGYNHYTSLREDASWLEVIIDSVEELGLGLLISALLLWLLDRISAGMALQEMLGQVILEAMVVAVGVSIGTAQLGVSISGVEGEENPPPAGLRNSAMPGLPGQLVLGVCGAFLIGANTGPTIEVIRIGQDASPIKLLFLVLVSLLLVAVILFFSNFIGSKAAHNKNPLLTLRGVGSAAMTYTIALVTAAFLLWFFGRFDGVGLPIGLAYTIVLGLPAALGASAGRLLLQG
jgi:putative integral membrane protein (TIGR02587 family)